MTVEGERLDGTKFSTKKPVYVRDDMLDESLREADVAVSYEALDKPSIWVPVTRRCISVVTSSWNIFPLHETNARRSWRERWTNDIW